MWIRRQTLAAQFHAEVVELALFEAVLEERARVDAGRGVPLEEDLITRLTVGLASEEVIEPDLDQAGRRRIGGKVTANALRTHVGPCDHHCRVPTDESAEAAFGVLVA